MSKILLTLLMCLSLGGCSLTEQETEEHGRKYLEKVQVCKGNDAQLVANIQAHNLKRILFVTCGTKSILITCEQDDGCPNATIKCSLTSQVNTGKKQ